MDYYLWSTIRSLAHYPTGLVIVPLILIVYQWIYTGHSKLHVYNYNLCTYFHRFSWQMAFCCEPNAEPGTKGCSVLPFPPVTGSWACSHKQITSCICKMKISTPACLSREGYWKTVQPSEPKAKSGKFITHLARKYCTVHRDPSVSLAPYSIFSVCFPG